MPSRLLFYNNMVAAVMGKLYIAAATVCFAYYLSNYEQACTALIVDGFARYPGELLMVTERACSYTQMQPTIRLPQICEAANPVANRECAYDRRIYHMYALHPFKKWVKT